MIISASRRTDIPRYYSQWFIHRIRTGIVHSQNPFNPNQVKEIVLSPETVDCIVFWTRDPSPLIPYLAELDKNGYNYYFLFTLIHYPEIFHPAGHDGRDVIHFKRLADTIGPDRIVWRYDPIIVSDLTTAAFHCENYGRLAIKLSGYTRRCIISFMDMYRNVKNRFLKTGRSELAAIPDLNHHPEIIEQVTTALCRQARDNNITLQSCSEKLSLPGIPTGSCIDTALINRLYNLNLDPEKDSGQRTLCGCAKSIDIGQYNTCTTNCLYCYAQKSPESARKNRERQDPDNPLLIPRAF